MIKSEENEIQPKLVNGYTPKDIEIRVVKSFLDILILIEMKKQNNISGYDIISFANEKFGGILSPGTVYATLYAMERKGLIHGKSDRRKTVDSLTEKGIIVVSSMMQNLHKEMDQFVSKFLMLE
jgi:DNA-binding PadR family transcriptional regulator